MPHPKLAAATPIHRRPSTTRARSERSGRDRAAARAAPAVPHAFTGWIHVHAADGTLLVDWDDHGGGPVPARTVVDLPLVSRDERPAALLVLDGGDAARPVVVGLFRAPGAAAAAPPSKRVIEVADELVLRCGAASVTLRRDRVIVRAPNVESRAAETNKVRGGVVKVN